MNQVFLTVYDKNHPVKIYSEKVTANLLILMGFGAPGTIRTCDRLVRSLAVLPRKLLIFLGKSNSRFYAIQWLSPYIYQGIRSVFYTKYSDFDRVCTTPAQE